MEMTPLAITLALGSLVLGITALALFAYLLIGRRRKKAQARAPQVAPPASAGAHPPPSEDSGARAPRERRQKPRQHSLFIIPDSPDDATNQRLTEWLKARNASFDPLKFVYHIDGEQPSNPITVANAFPPGEMPDLLHASTSDPIKGVSLLVKPPLRRRRNRQMVVYVELARELHELLGGTMLDSERQPASDATYERIING